MLLKGVLFLGNCQRNGSPMTHSQSTFGWGKEVGGAGQLLGQPLHAPPSQALRGEALGEPTTSLLCPLPHPPDLRAPAGAGTQFQRPLPPYLLEENQKGQIMPVKKGKNPQPATKHPSAPMHCSPSVCVCSSRLFPWVRKMKFGSKDCLWKTDSVPSVG